MTATLESTTSSLDAWNVHARRLAESAQRAVGVFPEVRSATFSIAGVPTAPELGIECTLLPGTATAAVIGTITSTVVENLQELLGAPFAERRITVSLAEREDDPADEFARAA